MSRAILILVTLFFTQNLFAVECVDKDGNDIYNEPEKFLSIIENSSSCYEATQMAEACARGASLDVQTAGTAYLVCQNELDKYLPVVKDNKSPKVIAPERALLANMNNMCQVKYEKAEGTMYLSMNAFCKLSAINWVVNIARPLDTEEN